MTSERVPLTYSPIRVISDIDDTVKLSGVHCGARAVFHNVFVKDLEDNLIPGMGEWYSEMWRRGVRFHYVVSSHTMSSLSIRNLKIVYA
jgi:phosphatidate phosphatase APP1